MQPATPRGYSRPGRPFRDGCAASLPAGLGSRAEPYSEAPGLVKTAPQLLLPHLHHPDLAFLYRCSSEYMASQAKTVQHETLVLSPRSAAPDMPLTVGRPSAPGILSFLFWKMGGKKKNLCPRLSQILLSGQTRVLCVNYSRKHGTFCNKGGSQAQENAQACHQESGNLGLSLDSPSYLL